MTDKMPVPLTLGAAPARSLCPVCGTTSYSREGIHPQCAQTQADGRRMARVKAVKKTAGPKARNPLALNPWHKRCPRCKAQLHIRKATCNCGHRFNATRPAN